MCCSNLEIKLFEDLKSGRNISLEKSLLILSGLKTEEEIQKYSSKIDKIQEKFNEYYHSKRGNQNTKSKIPVEIENNEKSGEIFIKAKLLHYYLCEENERNCIEDIFSFDKSNNLFLDYASEQKSNDVLSLSALYAVLSLRENINLGVCTSRRKNIISTKNNKFSLMLKINNNYEIICAEKNGFNVVDSDHEIEPFISPIDDLIRIFLINLAMKKQADGLYESSIFYNTKAIELCLKHPVSYSNRGYAFLHSNSFDDAISDFNKAIELDSDYTWAIYGRAFAYMSSSLFDNAIKDFSKVIASQPEFSEAYAMRGVAKARKSSFKEAILDFDMAIEINPYSADTYAYRAAAKEDLGLFQNSISDYSRAINIDSKNSKRYVDRAFIYIKLNKLKEALIDFKKASELNHYYKTKFSSIISKLEQDV